MNFQVEHQFTLPKGYVDSFRAAGIAAFPAVCSKQNIGGEI